MSEIKAWQTFMDSKGVLRFPSKNSVGKNASFSTASLKNREVKNFEQQRLENCELKRPRNHFGRPECLCGKFHDVTYCNYFNPNRPKSSWWKPNK